MLHKNELIPLKIESLSSEGSGVGRFGDIVVFVPFSAPGDEITARIIKVQKNYCIGKIEELHSPSNMRIPPDCAVFTKCGGCSFRHISYESELITKRKQVVDALERIGDISVSVLDILSSPAVNCYRNKSQIPVSQNSSGEIVYGFYARHSHRIVENDVCLLERPVFRSIAEEVVSFFRKNKLTGYSEESKKGLLRHIFLRSNIADDIMLCLVVNEELSLEDTFAKHMTSLFPMIKTIVLNYNEKRTNVILGEREKIIFGEGYIEDVLCDLSFQISPRSFYQVNREGAELLYGVAQQFAALSNEDVLLDLYCGVGTIGLSMANYCKRVIGIEVILDAVKNARKNAERNQIDNAVFYEGDAASLGSILERENLLPSVAVIDPPRKGCSRETIDALAAVNPKKIVYVSCNPATLARDLKIFSEHGYKIQKVQPVDMFPRTSHVEVVTLLINNEVTQERS